MITCQKGRLKKEYHEKLYQYWKAISKVLHRKYLKPDN